MGDIATKPVSEPRAQQPRAKIQKRVPSTPPRAKKITPQKKCFQHKGVYGSPHLIFLNKPYFGLGLKFGAAVQYRSIWKKGDERTWGIGGAFEIGISGINFLGSPPKKHAMLLLGIHAGIGIAKLVRISSLAQEQEFIEYTPRAGIDVHFVKFFSLSLFLKGGYILSMVKNNSGGKFETRHGAYAGIGAEFDVKFLSRALSPFIELSYSAYAGNRHELTAGAGLRY